MKFIKNYGWWVDSNLIRMLEESDAGQTKLHDSGRWVGHPSLEQYREKIKSYEYRAPGDSFQQFFKVSSLFKENPIILPELPETRNEIFWWIVKLKPGQFQTMHVDPHLYQSVNPVRYTMYLQDWQPGHIFVYKNKVITDYKAGDLFQWDDGIMEHGAANISFNTRYTIQISMQDKIIGDFLVPNKEAFN